MTEKERPAADMQCAGCGWAAPPIAEEPFPFRCPRARRGDDVDHVIRRTLDSTAVAFPGGGEANPFVRYRRLLHSHRVARSGGILDEEYVGLVDQLDRAVAALDGHGFSVTPFGRSAALSDRLGFGAAGGVWVKDETGNVSGSHKARHLMGIMLYLEVIERLGLSAAASGEHHSGTIHYPLPTSHCPLAIASCGNAALAAAEVARAGGWPLHVFVPQSADQSVVARLSHLGARITICTRQPGLTGDPCYLGFQGALGSGALPFCCQGSDNGLTIEGGETLAWEMIDALADTRLDRLIVQVGGGALASACVQAFSEAVDLGRLDRLPRFHAVQTRGGFPLKRAYDKIALRIIERISGASRLRSSGFGEPRGLEAEQAELIACRADPAIIQQELHFARTHRSQFMWPWEREPRSIAHGILDDETYDWAAVVEGMLLTGGSPIVVDEETLENANALARAVTGINVDHTGSAGLAGLLAVLAGSDPPAPSENIAVIFSGVKRAQIGTT